MAASEHVETAQTQASASAKESIRWIVLAQILRPQGRKGELLAELLTDFPERFAPVGDVLRRVFLAPSGFSGGEADVRTADVAAFWLPVGKNQGRIVLHFAGIDSINDAELLAGLEVVVPASERLELDDDASYISELIGCTLYDTADPQNIAAVGLVIDVEFPTTTDGNRRLSEAAPLLVVAASDSEEILVPFVKAFLVLIDLEAKRIEMSLPVGLVDVNRTP